MILKVFKQHYEYIGMNSNVTLITDVIAHLKICVLTKQNGCN